MCRTKCLLSLQNTCWFVGDYDSCELPSRKCANGAPKLLQMIGVSPESRDDRVFFNTPSLVSPKYWRRSLRPTITCEQPTALIIGPDTSPVNAPSFAQYRSCAPICILVPRVAMTAIPRSRNGGKITISQAAPAISLMEEDS